MTAAGVPAARGGAGSSTTTYSPPWVGKGIHPPPEADRTGGGRTERSRERADFVTIRAAGNEEPR